MHAGSNLRTSQGDAEGPREFPAATQTKMKCAAGDQSGGDEDSRRNQKERVCLPRAEQ